MGKTLVLCVDRDDDLGKKAKVKSPVLGKEDNIKAAKQLALADPADSDVNAIYKAVNVFNNLDEEDKLIATIVGHKSRGYKADKKIAESLDNLNEEYDLEEVILVSDGADDEQILPLIESRIPVASVQPVIIKQTKELEKSYHVLKEIFKDPFFARLIFGLPGVILAIYGLVNFFNIQEVSMNIILGLVGIYLIGKGFGIEEGLIKTFSSFKGSTSIERASFPLYLGSALLLLLGFWSGADKVSFVQQSISGTVLTAPEPIVLSAAFVSGFIGLFVLSSALFLLGRMGDMYHRQKHYLLKKYARSLVSMFALFIILDSVSKFAMYWAGAVSSGPGFMDLMISFGIAFIVTVVGFLIVNFIYVRRYVKRRLEEGMKVKDIDGTEVGEVTSVNPEENVFEYSTDGEQKASKFSDVFFIKESVVLKLSSL